MSATTEVRQDKSGNIFDAESFLEYLRPSKSHWWEGGVGKESCPWVFRGHASSKWKLIPSAFRSNCINELSPLISYFESLPVAECQSQQWETLTKNQKTYLHNSLAYGQAMYDFLTSCYEFGLLDFQTSNNFPQDYKKMEFKSADLDGGYFQCFTDFPSEDSRVFRKYYEVAQHYGVPTHLLDWSKSPLYAAHFATTSWLEADDTKADIAVWAIKEFQEQGIPKYNCNLSLFAPSIINNVNAKAQLGRFTVISRDGAKNYFHEYGSYPAIEDFFPVESDPNSYQIQKIVLCSEHVPGLRNLLDREGITNARLKPGFDSIVSTIKSSWKNLSNYSK
ncbi:MAG: FRG domain-containing protein [Methyloglobulus sp.]|nr:FRG domain-containing protein [Methyloglobulus sp.]